MDLAHLPEEHAVRRLEVSSGGGFWGGWLSNWDVPVAWRRGLLKSQVRGDGGSAAGKEEG